MKSKNRQVCEIQNTKNVEKIGETKKNEKKSLIYTFWLFTNLHLFGIIVLDKLNEAQFSLSKNIL